MDTESYANNRYGFPLLFCAKMDRFRSMHTGPPHAMSILPLIICVKVPNIYGFVKNHSHGNCFCNRYGPILPCDLEKFNDQLSLRVWCLISWKSEDISQNSLSNGESQRLSLQPAYTNCDPFRRNIRVRGDICRNKRMTLT